jgi:hypothetical protein
MLREVFVRPNTNRTDWRLLAMLFTSLLSFIGATALWVHFATGR